MGITFNDDFLKNAQAEAKNLANSIASDAAAALKGKAHELINPEGTPPKSAPALPNPARAIPIAALMAIAAAAILLFRKWGK